MFDYADKVILMSATISNHREYTKSIGISEKDYTYFEFESPFNPKKSPIFCSSKYPLSYNTMEKNLPKVLDMVLEICKRHSGEKGIIHTHTHAITQALRKKTKNDSRFLFREIGITNEDILSEHKRLEKVDTVIVSPSLDSGVSLDDDLGRFQIIVKAPFLSLGSKRIKKLFDKNPNYYVMKMLDTIVQMCGRCTRSVNDHSVTYIVDAVAVNSIKKHKDNLPRHFLHRFE
jgi:Rad3-related DNA helicase